ncbi:MAG: prepilin-type N-terminal cleavage/methylation domain-containing protein [Minisyncoccia bacterium]
MKINYNKAYTLVELLVVVAIIGVLSSIVITSANQSRAKGIDAAVKTNLVNAKLQAEVYFIKNGESFNNGTSNICASDFAQDGTTKSIKNYLITAIEAFGSTSYTYSTALFTASTATRAACHATANKWAMESPLKTGGNWCVDSAGTSKYTNTTLASGRDFCP